MAFYGWYMETRRWYMLVGVSTCLCCVGADGGGGGGGITELSTPKAKNE